MSEAAAGSNLELPGVPAMERRPEEPLAEMNALEASPLWSIVLVLAEIAARIERRMVEEHAALDEAAA